MYAKTRDQSTITTLAGVSVGEAAKNARLFKATKNQNATVYQNLSLVPRANGSMNKPASANATSPTAVPRVSGEIRIHVSAYLGRRSNRR